MTVGLQVSLLVAFLSCIGVVFASPWTPCQNEVRDCGDPQWAGQTVIVTDEQMYSNCTLIGCPYIAVEPGGKLILQNVEVRLSVGLDYGGAIQVQQNATLVMTNATFSSNKGANGGALGLVGGNAEGTNVTFYNNTAEYAGGVHIDANSSFTCTGCHFRENVALYGGGIYVSDKATLSWDGGSCTDQHAKWGGCLGVESSTAVVTNVAMARMSAEEGGSVFVQLDAVLELHHVSITDSHATSQAGCAYVYGHSRLTLDSTTWTGCSSDGDAGALWIASGDFYMRNASRIEAATAARDGGAIYALAGGSDIARIYLLEGSSIEDVQAEGVGGAALISEESFMVCSDSSITNGRAPTADGGGIAKIAGGKTTGALVLQNCQISNCAAGNRGGALTSDAPVFIIGDTHLTNNSAALDGGAVALHFNAKLQVAGAGVTLPNVGITFPQSANATVSIVGNTAHMCGGGVYADDEAMIVLGSGAVIKDNQAAKGEQLCLAQGLGGDFSVANTSSSLPGASVTGDVRVVDVEFAKVLAEKHVFGALGGAAPVGNPRWLEATYAGNGSLSIQPRERLPRLTVAAMDAFGNKLRPDYQHPVIVRLQAWRMAQNATSSSVRPVESYPLSGESIKAIIDEDTHEVTFDGLSISGEPAHYAILVTAVPGTIEVRSGDPNVSISFEIGLCDPQTQRYIKLTAAENGSCYPIMAVPWFIRFVFAAVGVVCILITLTLMFLIFKHRDIQIVKSGSPVLTLIACGGSCLSFLSLPARLLPDQWGCTAAAWLDNLGFYAFFTVIILKTYRIEVIFNKAGMRRSEAEKVRNAALLRHVAVIMFFVTAGLVIWTIVSPPIPNASTITVGFVPVDRCTSSPFSIGFLLFRLIFQAAGTYLAVLVRNVVAAFNESKLIAFTTYNFAVFGALLTILVEFAVPYSTVAFAMNGVSILLSHSIGIALLCAMKVYVVLKDPERANQRPDIESKSKSLQPSKLGQFSSQMSGRSTSNQQL